MGTLRQGSGMRIFICSSTSIGSVVFDCIQNPKQPRVRRDLFKQLLYNRVYKATVDREWLRRLCLFSVSFSCSSLACKVSAPSLQNRTGQILSTVRSTQLSCRSSSRVWSVSCSAVDGTAASQLFCSLSYLW